MVKNEMSSKTPVSILQEMCIRKGDVPQYELIHDGGGSHEALFKYRVLVGDSSGSLKLLLSYRFDSSFSTFKLKFEASGFCVLPSECTFSVHCKRLLLLSAGITPSKKIQTAFTNPECLRAKSLSGMTLGVQSQSLENMCV